MDARVLLITADSGLAGLLRPQVENQGAACVVAEGYDEARPSLEWADAAMIDLELPEGGLDVFRRVRLEAPEMPVVAVAATTDAAAAVAGEVERVLLEPFSIADVVDAVRALAPPSSAPVIDLTDDAAAPADAPWWATR